MSTVNETIITGRKYRQLIDKTQKLWGRFSFWNKADDTECNDGKSVETKVGAINGITSSTTSEAEDIAISAKAFNELKNNLQATDGLSFRFATDGEGNHGYLGADDSFIPFKGFSSTQYIKGLYSVNKPTNVRSGLILVSTAHWNGWKSSATTPTGQVITKINKIADFYSDSTCGKIHFYAYYAEFNQESGDITVDYAEQSGDKYMNVGLIGKLIVLII